MEIKVLGTGCPNCKKTKAVIAEALKEMNIEASIVEVQDIPLIMAYGVMSTPAIVIDEKVVMTYHGGKVEATGFRVADAVMIGDTGEALRLLRHAIAVGVDPVPIVADLAQQVRQLIKVGSAGRGRSADVARDVGMAPWQVDKARRALGGWTAEGLAVSLQALAAADFEVKGGGRDPVYAVERVVLTITGQHSRNQT